MRNRINRKWENNHLTVWVTTAKNKWILATTAKGWEFNCIAERGRESEWERPGGRDRRQKNYFVIRLSYIPYGKRASSCCCISISPNVKTKSQKKEQNFLAVCKEKQNERKLILWVLWAGGENLVVLSVTLPSLHAMVHTIKPLRRHRLAETNARVARSSWILTWTLSMV